MTHQFEEGKSIFEIRSENGHYIKEIRWSKNYSEDLIKLSREYFKSAYNLATEINSGERHDNVKTDMWFLPSIYLFRQSIELLLKGGIANSENYNPKLQEIFVDCKHDLKRLYSTLLRYKDSSGLHVAEQNWLSNYLDELEKIDRSSDLFRYPHSREFMKKYGDKFLDVAKMWNRLMQCYSLLHKEVFDVYYLAIEFCIDDDPRFFSFAEHGFGNCHLWDSPWGDGFYKQVVGYSEAGDFLYENSKSSDFCSIYPFTFLYRNAIELALKRLLFTRTEICVDVNVATRIKNTHELKRTLWRNIKPILKHYGEVQNYDLKELELAESYIDELSRVDKNSDTFRYPFTYSFEYKLNNILLDIDSVHTYLKTIFKFLDNCELMLSAISDSESEMRGYYYE